MGMYNLIEDNVNKFYDVAMEKIGECESCNEFMFAMKPHEHMLLGSDELEYVQDGGYTDMWEDFWSDKI